MKLLVVVVAVVLKFLYELVRWRSLRRLPASDAELNGCDRTKGNRHFVRLQPFNAVNSVKLLAYSIIFIVPALLSVLEHEIGPSCIRYLVFVFSLEGLT